MDRVAAVRAVYDEWERGNYRAGLGLYDPDMTLEVHNPIPDAGVYEGLAGLQRYMRRFLETWDEYHIRAASIEEAGDRVIVHVEHGGVGRTSRARTETHFLQAWTFDEDRVVRVDIGREL